MNEINKTVSTAYVLSHVNEYFDSLYLQAQECKKSIPLRQCFFNVYEETNFALFDVRLLQKEQHDFGFFIYSQNRHDRVLTCNSSMKLWQRYNEKTRLKRLNEMFDFDIGKNDNALLQDMHAEHSAYYEQLHSCFEAKVPHCHIKLNALKNTDHFIPELLSLVSDNKIENQKIERYFQNAIEAFVGNKTNACMLFDKNYFAVNYRFFLEKIFYGDNHSISLEQINYGLVDENEQYDFVLQWSEYHV